MVFLIGSYVTGRLDEFKKSLTQKPFFDDVGAGRGGAICCNSGYGTIKNPYSKIVRICIVYSH